MDDNHSVSVAELCGFSDRRGLGEIAFDHLVSLPDDANAEFPFQLFNTGAGPRLAVSSGHDFDALCVPSSLRAPPSPAPASAGNEVFGHNLPEYVVLGVRGN